MIDLILRDKPLILSLGLIYDLAGLALGVRNGSRRLLLRFSHHIPGMVLRVITHGAGFGNNAIGPADILRNGGL